MDSVHGYLLFYRQYSPGISTVIIEDVEFFWTDEFTAVDSRLDRSKTTQYSDLFHITYNWNDIETLQFGIDGVQSPDKVLEKQFKCLGKADQLTAIYIESGDFGSPIVDHFTLVVLRVGRSRWRGAVDRLLQLEGHQHPCGCGGYRGW